LQRRLNPAAELVHSDLEVSVEQAHKIRGKRVLIVEDGPTVTHGGMAYGAGWVAAGKYGAGEILDPEPFAVGSIRETFAANPHLRQVVPAMGYSEEQRAELKATIEGSGADVVINASPANITELLELSLPVVQVRYGFVPRAGVDIFSRVAGLLTAPGPAVLEKRGRIYFPLL
jgi:predicted GTPase